MSTAHAARVTACAVGPDGSFFASASVDNTVRLWDSSSGENIRTLVGHPDEVLHCAVGPDEFVYSAGSGIAAGFLGCVKVWDPHTGDEVASWDNSREEVVGRGILKGLALSPAGDLVAAFDDMAGIEILDPITGRRERRIDGKTHVPETAFFAPSPDGAFLVVTMADELRVVMAATGETITAFEKGRGPFAIAPDAKTVVFGGPGGWTVGEIPSGRALEVAPGRFTTCVVSPDGSLVAAAFQRGAQQYSSPTGAGASKIGTAALHIRSAQSGDLVREVDLGDEEAIACAFSPDVTLLFVAGRASLRVLDVENGDEVGNIPLDAEATCMAVHPSRPIVALGDAAGGFHVLDVGLDLGRLIVTAAIHGEGAGTEVRCPACSQVFEAAHLVGTDIECPNCRGGLRVNPFVLHMRATPSRPPLARAASTPAPAATPAANVPAVPLEAPPQITDLNEEVKAMLFEEVAEAGINLQDFSGKLQQMIVASALTESVKGLLASTNDLLDASQQKQLREISAAGNPTETIRFLHEALPAFDVLGTVREGLRAAYPVQATPGNRGKMLIAMGDPDEALPLFEEQERLSRESGDRAGHAESLGNQAVLIRAKGDLGRALALHEEEERIFREIGEREGLSRSLGNRALLLRAMGRDDDAMTLLEERESICRETGDQSGLARSLGNQAEILGNRGQFDKAVEMLADVVGITREQEDWEQLGAALAGRGVFLSNLGRTNDALEALEEALTVANEHDLTQLAGQIEPFVLGLRQQAVPTRGAPASLNQQVFAILSEEIAASGINLESYPEGSRTTLVARAMNIALTFIVQTAAPQVLPAPTVAELQGMLSRGEVDRTLELLNDALPEGDFLRSLREVLKQAIPVAASMPGQAGPGAAPAEKQKRGLFRRKH